MILVAFALVSCGAQIAVSLPPVDNVERPSDSELTQYIPEEEFARIGLLSAEDLPANATVTRRFEEGISTSSLTRSSGSGAMIAEITLTGYLYNGYRFTTSTPLTVTYPGISAGEEDKYSLEKFVIDVVDMVMSPETNGNGKRVSISDSAGYLPYDAVNSSENTIITVSGTAVTAVENIPASSDIAIDSYEGSYSVNGTEISKEEAVGVDGSEDKPYTVSRLSDLLLLDSLFSSSSSVNIRLESDLTITAEWVVSTNMVDPITISNGENVTIDFDGHTITYEVAGNLRPFLVEEGGSLTLNNGVTNSIDAGEGGVTITNTEALGLVDNYGTLTINGGSYDIQTKRGTCAIRSFDGAMLTINDGRFYFPYTGGTLLSYGTAYINDGYFYSNSNSQIYGESYTYNIRNDGGDMIIRGGEVYGIQGGISTVSGSLVIQDVYSETGEREVEGTMVTASFYAIYVAGESGETSCVINGGTFVAGVRNALHVGNSNPGGDGGIMADATCTVNGGTFISESGSYDVAVDYGIGALTLYGGSFAHRDVKVSDAGSVIEPSIIDTYTAAGHHVEETADGFEVVED